MTRAMSVQKMVSRIVSMSFPRFEIVNNTCDFNAHIRAPKRDACSYVAESMMTPGAIDRESKLILTGNFPVVHDGL